MLNFFPLHSDDECISEDGRRVGACLNVYECRLQGGHARGECALGFGVCCVCKYMILEPSPWTHSDHCNCRRFLSHSLPFHYACLSILFRPLCTSLPLDIIIRTRSWIGIFRIGTTDYNRNNSEFKQGNGGYGIMAWRRIIGKLRVGTGEYGTGPDSVACHATKM